MLSINGVRCNAVQIITDATWEALRANEALTTKHVNEAYEAWVNFHSANCRNEWGEEPEYIDLFNVKSMVTQLCANFEE